MDERRALANKPISIGRQLMYSFSDLASNPIYTIMMSFLTFFYTDVLGVNPALIGTLLLFCKVFDGVTDIAAGSIVERTHTKNGSARPWVLRTMVPLSVSLVLLFTVPNCGTVGKEETYECQKTDQLQHHVRGTGCFDGISSATSGIVLCNRTAGQHQAGKRRRCRCRRLYHQNLS